MKNKIKLIIGLGNPGEKYTNTYHNAGHMFADWLASKSEEDADWKSLKAFDYAGKIGGITPAKTNVFMNESGVAVKAAAKKFGIKPKELAVAQDESDIELGKYKISYDRNSAGHKGIDSVFKSLGTKSFWRIRIGIRKNKGKALEFVLKKISRADAAKFEKVFEAIAKEIL